MSFFPGCSDLRRYPPAVRHLEASLPCPGSNSRWLRLNGWRCGVRVDSPAETVFQHRCAGRNLKFVLAGAEPSIGPLLGERASLAEHDRHRWKLRLQLG